MLKMKNDIFLFLRETEKQNIVSSFCVLTGCFESDLKQFPGQIWSNHVNFVRNKAIHRTISYVSSFNWVFFCHATCGRLDKARA